MPTILNAANEVAVDAFLQSRIGFTAIAAIVDESLEKTVDASVDTLEDALMLDAAARRHADAACKTIGSI